MPNDETVNVRYMVDDVDESIAFYTKLLGFELLTSASPAFADVKRGNLRLLLAGPTSSAGRPMPDGAKPGPGGWNRIHFIVDDLDDEVARLRDARRAVPQRHRGRARRQADPAPRPVRQRRRALRARRSLSDARDSSRRWFHEPRDAAARPSLRTIVGQWGRIGCIGFGGPPAHIALLRDLCVERKQWINPREFEDAIAACNLLPGPASTQLAIFSAWRVAGPLGAIVGGAAFIVPGLVLILGLAALFLAAAPPTWVLGAGAGAGAAVAAVAVRAGTDLIRPSLSRATARWRWVLYALLGATAAATLGPWLVLVLLACGLVELALCTFGRTGTLGTHTLAAARRPVRQPRPAACSRWCGSRSRSVPSPTAAASSSSRSCKTTPSTTTTG